MRRNIGIIGYGFISKSLVKNLSERNIYNLRILDRNPKPKNFNHEWYEGDYRNGDLLKKFVKNLDVIYHLASSTVPCSIKTSAKDDLDENIISILKLLDILIIHNPNLYFIFASSASVYGNQDLLPISELNLPSPLSLYGIQKLTIEHYLKYYSVNHNIKYVACRISNPYGFGQKPNTLQGIISIIKNCIKNNYELTLYGEEESSRDFIHIDDLANGIISLLKTKSINNVINISSGREVAILELIKLIENYSGSKIKKINLPLRRYDIRRSVLDNSLIKSLTNWNPKITLEDGIKDFFSD